MWTFAHGSQSRGTLRTEFRDRGTRQNRRFTRLTNAFSKKWESHQAMFALFAAHYNFCRKHSTLKTTPAVAAGLAREPWTIKQLLTESAKAMAA